MWWHLEAVRLRVRLEKRIGPLGAANETEHIDEPALSSE